MTEQLGVVGGDDQRRALHVQAQPAGLFGARAQEVLGVRHHSLSRRDRVVVVLLVKRDAPVITTAGDAVILLKSPTPRRTPSECRYGRM